MPYRNGILVNWKTKIMNWGEVLNGDDETPDKLRKLAALVEPHPVLHEEYFHERLLEAADIDNEYECEAIGNDVLAEIYDFADEKLIWLEP